MKNIISILFVVFILLYSTIIEAQKNFTISKSLKIEFDSTVKNRILSELDTLFDHIKHDNLSDEILTTTNKSFNKEYFKSLKDVEISSKDTSKIQLVNFYKSGSKTYRLALAYLSDNKGSINLKCLVELIVNINNNHIKFESPLKENTQNWKSIEVGNVTYIYEDTIDVNNARYFDQKNIMIATKLGYKPEKFNFYMCSNYQDVLKIMGYVYDSESNGITRDGYGVVGNTIFSIENNEDFSHDLLHYYAAKVRENVKRNHAAEEGLAYYWGNAYYVDKSRKMVELTQLKENLKEYLIQNQNANLLDLFSKNTRNFSKLAPEFSLKSTIAGLICELIEKEKGIDGIKTLIKCGKGDDAFFEITNQLVGINQSNFESKVRYLIDKK